MAGSGGVGGKVVATVGVGAPVNGVAVGVPANGVGVPGADVGAGVGTSDVGVAPGVEPPPRPGVEVVETVPLRVGVVPGAGVPNGGGVTTVPWGTAVGVGLASPFGSDGDLESHAPSTAPRITVARNGLTGRTGSQS